MKKKIIILMFIFAGATYMFYSQVMTVPELIVRTKVSSNMVEVDLEVDNDKIKVDHSTAKVNLLLDDTVIDSIDLLGEDTKIVFDDLRPKMEYQIKIIFEYNYPFQLFPGNLDQTVIFETSFDPLTVKEVGIRGVPILHELIHTSDDHLFLSILTDDGGELNSVFAKYSMSGNSEWGFRSTTGDYKSILSVLEVDEGKIITAYSSQYSSSRNFYMDSFTQEGSSLVHTYNKKWGSYGNEIIKKSNSVSLVDHLFFTASSYNKVYLYEFSEDLVFIKSTPLFDLGKDDQGEIYYPDMHLAATENGFVLINDEFDPGTQGTMAITRFNLKGERIWQSKRTTAWEPELSKLVVDNQSIYMSGTIDVLPADEFDLFNSFLVKISLDTGYIDWEFILDQVDVNILEDFSLTPDSSIVAVGIRSELGHNTAKLWHISEKGELISELDIVNGTSNRVVATEKNIVLVNVNGKDMYFYKYPALW